MPVHFLDTVRSALTRKVMPLHGSRETTPLAGSGNINRLRVGKDLDTDLLTNLNTVGRPAELADKLLWLAIRFCSGNSIPAAARFFERLLLNFAYVTTCDCDLLRFRSLSPYPN